MLARASLANRCVHCISNDSFIANARNISADARNRAEVCWSIQVEVSRLSCLCCADIVREEGIAFHENSESGSGRNELSA